MAGEEIHRHWMAVAIRLARRGAGSVSPNPMVGAVIVRGGRKVGEGYHRGPGHSHAEVAALRQAGLRARGADLYVNLEPCCHHGRTPPCTDAILASGIRRVWVSIRDPDARVRGRGIRTLRRSGVEVNVGLLAAEAEDLNEFYLRHARTGRPFVILKLATTLDGRIATATGKSRWITGVEARRHGHVLRGRVDAVLVGLGTVRADDPRLTVRMGVRCRKPPARIVLDTHLRIPVDARVLAPGSGLRTVVACGPTAPRAREERLRRLGAEVWRCPLDAAGRVRLSAVIGRAGREGMASLLIEGGRGVATSALRERAPDRVVLCMSAGFLGGDALSAVGDLGVRSPARAVSLSGVRCGSLGADLLVEGSLGAKERRRCSRAS